MLRRCSRLKPVWEHAAGLIDKTTTDYGEAPTVCDREHCVSCGTLQETFHGFTDRHEAMFSWEEYNMQASDTHPTPPSDTPIV